MVENSPSRCCPSKSQEVPFPSTYLTTVGSLSYSFLQVNASQVLCTWFILYHFWTEHWLPFGANVSRRYKNTKFRQHVWYKITKYSPAYITQTQDDKISTGVFVLYLEVKRRTITISKSWQTGFLFLLNVKRSCPCHAIFSHDRKYCRFRRNCMKKNRLGGRKCYVTTGIV